MTERRWKKCAKAWIFIKHSVLVSEVTTRLIQTLIMGLQKLYPQFDKSTEKIGEYAALLLDDQVKKKTGEYMVMTPDEFTDPQTLSKYKDNMKVASVAVAYLNHLESLHKKLFCLNRPESATLCDWKEIKKICNIR